MHMHTCKYVSLCAFATTCAQDHVCIGWKLENVNLYGSCVMLYNFLLIDSQVFLDLAEKDMKQINALFREVI